MDNTNSLKNDDIVGNVSLSFDFIFVHYFMLLCWIKLFLKLLHEITKTCSSYIKTFLRRQLDNKVGNWKRHIPCTNARFGIIKHTVCVSFLISRWKSLKILSVTFKLVNAISRSLSDAVIVWWMYLRMLSSECVLSAHTSENNYGRPTKTLKNGRFSGDIPR